MLCAANPALLLPTVRSRCVLIRRNADAAEDEQSAADALALLSALAAGDRVSLLRWEFGSEDMDPRRAAAMINAAREELADILRGEGRVSMPAPRCVGLDALFAKCSAMLRLNVSVRHVFGLIAVGGVRK